MSIWELVGKLTVGAVACLAIGAFCIVARDFFERVVNYRAARVAEAEADRLRARVVELEAELELVRRSASSYRTTPTREAVS